MSIQMSHSKRTFFGVLSLLVYALLPIIGSLAWEQALIVVLALLLGFKLTYAINA